MNTIAIYNDLTFISKFNATVSQILLNHKDINLLTSSVQNFDDESDLSITVINLHEADPENKLLEEILTNFLTRIDRIPNRPIQEIMGEGHLLIEGDRHDTILIHANDSTIHIVCSRTGQW